MFIVELNPNESVRALLAPIEQKMGGVPEHLQLLATVNPKRLQMFMQEIFYLSTHERINPLLFVFIRFYVATKEGFSYCERLNKSLLLKAGINMSMEIDLESFWEKLPFDDAHKLLAKKAELAVWEPERFTQEDINMLLSHNWQHSDIYDAIDHMAFLFKNAKIIKAYSR